jgi:hypothetical protein
VSSSESVTRRRKVFDKHLLGLVLGESELEDVRKKVGEPARVLEEERVTVLEYDSPKEQSIARWKKVQFIFFDDLLLNVTYAEPEPELTRTALHKVLGEPDGDPDEADADEDDEGPSDIFDVELEEEPMLSFVAHYKDAEARSVEALSLCADMLDDGDEDEITDDEDGGEGEGDEGDESGEDDA